jgi:hypothetical protein
MSEINRMVIVFLAALVIIVMAVLVFIAWAAADDAIQRLGDFVQFLNDHNDDPSKLILTLGALTLVVLAILVIVVELAPEQEAAELRVEQEGATTIVSTEGLRQRLEDVLLALPAVSSAKVGVASRNKGIAAAVELTVVLQANVAAVSQEAIRAVTRTLQEEMGLPLAEAPRLRITFGAALEAPPASPSAGVEPTRETSVPEAGEGRTGGAASEGEGGQQTPWLRP